MTAPGRFNGGAQRAVRLTTIPLKIRRRYGWSLIERAKDDGDIIAAVALTAAVENPSDKIYWVSANAVKKVLGDGIKDENRASLRPGP